MANLVWVNDAIKGIWGSSVNLPVVAEISTYFHKVVLEDVYVQPKLRVIERIEEEINLPPILLMSAPGAVGKTTLAKYATEQKKGYYWDLSKIILGNNSFIGTLAEAFEPNNLATIITKLADGELSLFIDALDEAEMSSGWSGLEKFIEDMYKYVKNSPKPNIVLFARTSTAELVQMKLDEIAINANKKSYQLFEIDYFEQNGASSFIKSYMKKQGATRTISHNQAIDNCVKSIFDAISKTMSIDPQQMWDEFDSRSFIGYAPVLQTIATFLTNQNFEAITQLFLKDSHEKSCIKIINDFIKALLVREQLKVVEGLKKKFSITPNNWNAWDSLYTPREQVQRVFLREQRDNDYKNEIVPDWLKTDYQEAIDTFMPSHPFLRGNNYSSPAFRDFSYSQLIRNDIYGKRCLRKLQQTGAILTPLFYQFFLENAGEEYIVPGTMFGFLYESITSRENYGSYISLEVEQKVDSIYRAEFIPSEDRKSGSFSVLFSINDDHPLTIYNRLQNATLNNVSELNLVAKDNASFDLSNVSIWATKMGIFAKTINCQYRDSSGIFLRVDSEPLFEDNVNISHYGVGSLSINWPNGNTYPWSAYYIDLSEEMDAIYSEIYALKRILEPFRKHGKNDFAKHHEYIDNIVVGKNELRVRMRNYLLAKDIIRKNRSDNQYILDSERFNDYGLNWSGLINMTMNTDLYKFIMEFRAN